MIFPNSCSINYLIVLATAQLPSCPEAYGEQAYAHPDACDQFFLCTNGTLTLETCENGLIFGKGAVHNHCGYNWHYETDCAGKKYDRELLYHDCVSFFFNFASFIATPISNGICEYLFGIYEDSPQCSTTYVKCEFGVPHQLPCTKGLVYDEKIKGCNWPDLLLEKCNPEAVIGFKCPAKVDPRSQAAKFWPFPRFPG